MALAEVNFFSQALMRTVPFYAIIPCDKMRFDGKREEVKPFKTLYLLHGIFGNYTDWVTGTRIQRFATDYNLAVIMPSGDNKFYTYNKNTDEDYSKFIEELVYVTRDMFNLSHEKEDTFIGGLSMGGYGALANGLIHTHLFSKILSFSGATEINILSDFMDESVPYPMRSKYMKSIFGDEPDLKHSNKDIHYLVDKLAKSGKELPEVYIGCGYDDPFYEANKALASEMKDLNYDVVFQGHEGAHEWDYWDWAIKDAIENFLPLEPSEAISSGNVSKD